MVKNLLLVSSFLVLLLVLVTGQFVAAGRRPAFPRPSRPSSSSTEVKSSSSDGRVNIGVYYESLCPDSIRFFRDQLWHTYAELADVIDVDLVPYGKAKSIPHGDSWSFTCQHGPDECQGNRMQACAIAKYQNPNKQIPFTHCVMTSDNPPMAGQQCAQQVGIDWNTIQHCTATEDGNALLHEMGVKTEALNPHMYFVPWITINGVHTEEIQDQALSNLFQLVCSTYSGPKPSTCK